MLKKEKGFLGPIGDDLPSLIPLIFALIIFFSTFTFALNQFNLTNADIATKLEILRVSRILKGNGYVGSYADFQKLCDSVPLTSVKFKAGLVDVSAAVTDTGEVLALDEASDFIYDTDSGKPFICPSKNFETVEEAFEDFEAAERARVYSLIYPIALEKKHEDSLTGGTRYFVLPVHLVIVAWKD